MYLESDSQYGGTVANGAVTAQQDGEESSDKTKKRFRSIAGHAPDVISRFDREFRHLYVSPSVEAVTGRPASEFIGKTNADLGMPDDLVAQWQATLQQVLDTGAQATLEFDFPSATGVRSFHMIAVPEFDDDGAVETILNIARDITDRRKREEVLQASEERLQRVINATHAMVYEVDLDTGRPAYASGFVEFLGFDSNQISHDWWFSQIHPDDRERVEQGTRALIAGTGRETLSYRVRHRDGHYLHVEDTCTVLPDRDSGTIRMIGSIVDVSERVEAERKRVAYLDKLRLLIDEAGEVMKEETTQGVLSRVVKAARKLTGGRLVTSGHGYRDGVFEVGAVSKGDGIAPCPPGHRFEIEKGGVYLDVVDKVSSIRLTEEELLSHPAWWGLPEGHAPLRGLLATRLVGRDGEACGLIMVSDKEQGDFTPEDQVLLSQLGILTSLGLQHIEARLSVESEVAARTAELQEAMEILEREIRRSERRRKVFHREREILQSVVETIPVMLCMYDEAGKMRMVNREFTRKIGFSQAEATRVDIMETCYPDPAVRQEVWEYMMEASPGTWKDMDVRTRDGDAMPTSWANVRMADGSRIGIGIDLTERTAMEEDLTRTKTLLERVFDSLKDAVFVVNPETRTVTTCNAAVGTVFGYTADEVIGRNTEFLHVDRDHYEAFAEKLFPALEATGIYQGEFEMRQRDGTIFPTENTCTEIRDAEGARIGVVSVVRDITDRKRMEEDLRETSALLERIFANVKILVAYMDTEYTFVRVNQSYAEADGRTPEFYPGKNHFDLYPNEENKAIFREVVETGRPYIAFEKPFHYPRHPERGTTYWDWTLHPVLDLDEKVEGLVLTLIDVTERKRLEQERTLMAAALAQTDDSVMIIDAKGGIEYVNTAFSRLHRIDEGTAVGRHFREFWAGGESDAIITEAIENAVGWTGRVARQYSDGRPYTVEMTLSPLRDDQGKVSRYVSVERDITHEMLLEAQVRQRQKMEALGTLAGGIAHDFNNILMPIVMNTELTMMDLVPESPAHRSLGQVLEAAQIGKDLVKQILSFSRPQADVRQAISLGPLVKEALKFLRASIPATIELQESVDAPWAVCSVDPSQIHQVIVNLCTNAAQAIGQADGVIQVSLTEEEVDEKISSRHPNLKPGACARLAVSDNGPGIGAAFLDRVFDPFFTTRQSGTGMGLAVVQGIVRSHDGAVEVHSQPGDGATFLVYLPVAGPGTVEHATCDDEVPGGDERVLLVDDQKEVLDSLEPMLTRLGYRVTAVTDSMDALGRFRSQPQNFDLVITDQVMPDLTGVELAEEILAIRLDLPVILTTGYSEEATATGIRAVMRKPFNLKELAQTVRRVLDKHQ
jgi:PAS domain S-box-containing protein